MKERKEKLCHDVRTFKTDQTVHLANEQSVIWAEKLKLLQWRAVLGLESE